MMLTLAAVVATCQPQAIQYEVIREQFGESRVAAYITNGGALEVWSSPRGTWTMTQTRPDGLTCIVATGRGAYAFPLPVDGEPA